MDALSVGQETVLAVVSADATDANAPAPNADASSSRGATAGK